MDGELVLFIGRRALETALLLAAPILGITFVVGFVVAMLQAVTSIRDMTMGMILKLACVGAAALVFGGWMLQLAVGFTREIFYHIQALTG